MLAGRLMSRAPLIRVHLLQLGADDHVLLFNMHHIVSDGWSMDMLSARSSRYRAGTENSSANLHRSRSSTGIMSPGNRSGFTNAQTSIVNSGATT